MGIEQSNTDPKLVPGSALAELILWPILELILYVAGYLTGYVVVPIVTLGRYQVEPFVVQGRKRYGKSRKYSFARKANVVSDDAATLIGLLFWVAVTATIYLIWRFSNADTAV